MGLSKLISPRIDRECITMRQVKPRNGHFYGMAISGVTYDDGTWLEDEAFAYPAGGSLDEFMLNVMMGSKGFSNVPFPILISPFQPGEKLRERVSRDLFRRRIVEE